MGGGGGEGEGSFLYVPVNNFSVVSGQVFLG